MAILQIPITKGGKGAFIKIDTDLIPEAIYAAALAQGLKDFANRGMSKITVAKLEGEELAKANAAAMVIAEKQKAAILDGTMKLPGTKATAKASGAVMTEARRLAKNIIKDLMKQSGIKISHVDAKDITSAANELLEQDPSLIETAKANLAAREALPIPGSINIKNLIRENPIKVAAAAAKKAKEKAEKPLSAKQAGKVKPRVNKAPQAQA